MAIPTLDQATTPRQLSSHTYEINLDNEWCIGSVPHGGYVTSCFLAVSHLHFSTTLARQNQPHPMTVHMEFPKRTEQGPALFTVRDVKLGRQTSTIHISLSQHGKEEVLCYINQSNLTSEDGVSFETGWEMEPPPAPTPDFKAFEKENEKNWAEQGAMPFQEFRRASNRVRFFFPREGQKLTSVGDQWIKFRDGTKFTTESLGYVADMFPMVVESYTADEDPYKVGPSTKEHNGLKKKPAGAKFWYPTVVLNIDVKKALPKEGVDWLFCRARSKLIAKGRLDIEVVIMDEAGDLIALSHHVALVLSASRNLAARKQADVASKI
jgi:acyl-CoA thioesterase